MQKAQGALEYLLLLGGTLVVASVIIILLLNLQQIGAFTAKGSFYRGEIKKLEILLKIDLSQTRSRYQFENNVIDTGGSGYDGTIINGTLSYAPGKIGQAIQFTGVGPKVSVNPKALSGLGDFTIMGWFRLDSSSTGYMDIFTGRSGVDEGVILQVNSSLTDIKTTLTNSNERNYNYLAESPPAALTSWRHIAWTRSGGTETVYLDCKLIDTPSTVTSTPTGANTITLDLGVNSAMDDFWIIGKAMPANDIRILAQGCP